MRQMSERKTARRRLAGHSESKRLDAKFFLLALTPFLPILLSDQLGWPRGILWHGWFWLSVAWAIGVVGILFIAYWRTLRRSGARKRPSP